MSKWILYSFTGTNVDSHNCLVMDDDTLKPLMACGHRCFWGGYPPRHGLGLVRSGGPIELLEAWHDAYVPTRHRRFFVHVRGIGFVFIDILGRPELDLRPRQYAQRFHLELGVRSMPRRPAPGAALGVSKGAARALIIPGREVASLWNGWADERLRHAGALPVSTRPPQVAELVRVVQGPAVFTTRLVTDRAARAARRTRPVPVYLGSQPGRSGFRQHEGLSAHDLDLGAAGRLLVATCPYGERLDHPMLATDGEAAVVHLDPHGRIKAWCLARGSRLAVNGRDLVRGTHREWREG